ncbi:MAG: hypothetical protein PHW04_07770 [Candidatus Wallbacteria bacterium]|nr:hypothetical protein [Candidatus Wallbacteria bacterium]
MKFKQVIFLFSFLLLEGALFFGCGYFFFIDQTARFKNEIIGRYETLLELIVYQVENVKDEQNFFFLKKSLERLLKDDPYFSSFTLTGSDGGIVMQVGEVTVEVSDNLEFSRDILKAGKKKGNCRISVFLGNYRHYCLSVKFKLTFYLSLLYFLVFLLVLNYFYFAFLRPERIFARLLGEIDPARASETEDLKLFFLWNRLKSQLAILLRRITVKVGEAGLSHPITGLPGYYYTQAKLTRDLKSGTHEYLVLHLIGLNLVSVSSGFIEGYRFLEELVTELQEILHLIQPDAFLGHLTDTTLVARVNPATVDSCIERVLKAVQDWAAAPEKHCKLQKDWAKMIVFVFSSAVLDRQELGQLEKLYFSALTKFKRKNIKNSAYRYEGSGELILLYELGASDEKKRTDVNP